MKKACSSTGDRFSYSSGLSLYIVHCTLSAPFMPLHINSERNNREAIPIPYAVLAYEYHIQYLVSVELSAIEDLQ